MIPQHQAKNKETTRVVNQDTLERPVLVRLGELEESRRGGWDWLIQVIVLGSGGEARESQRELEVAAGIKKKR